MDAKWGIIAFRHNGGRISYIWTHATVHVLTELTETQREKVRGWAKAHGIWWHDGHQMFLCTDAAERGKVVQSLKKLGWLYESDLSPLSEINKQVIERAQITRRDEIANLLDAPSHIYQATVTALELSKPRGIEVGRGARREWCYGVTVPKIGDIVLVTFVDGDPKKPCVLGKVLGL